MAAIVSGINTVMDCTKHKRPFREYKHLSWGEFELAEPVAFGGQLNSAELSATQHAHRSFETMVSRMQGANLGILSSIPPPSPGSTDWRTDPDPEESQHEASLAISFRHRRRFIMITIPHLLKIHLTLSPRSISLERLHRRRTTNMARMSSVLSSPSTQHEPDAAPMELVQDLDHIVFDWTENSYVSPTLSPAPDPPALPEPDLLHVIHSICLLCATGFSYSY
ncbi:hypothetical protein C8F04DRAFT_1273877 [Mycena alexandri]|uniref:Uncharacterized protein n=1 Tax=Mycena alexandri TaxID=1745969 RepID=A0AAD6S8Z9_9AGAR|nr:hypothetical protein C8F04DRAFT_1273877 [Mycena alexandri]